MALAALLLKLGGYGLYLVQGLGIYRETVVIGVCIVGGVFSCFFFFFFCLGRSDVTSLIAYCSVFHILFVMLAMLISGY